SIRVRRFLASWRGRALIGLFGLGLAGAAGWTVYQLFQDTDIAWKHCTSSAKIAPPKRVADCSVVISSGKETGRALATALAQRGAAYLDTQNHAAALLDFDAALRASPNDPALYLARGNARLRSGAPEQAISDFTSALALDGTLTGALMGRGNAQLSLANPQAAEADFTAAIAQSASAADAYYRRAIANVRQAKIVEALGDYDQAIALQPASHTFLNGRCWFRATQGIDLDLALKDCDEAVRLRPDFAAAIDSRAFVLLRLERFAEARQAYDLALQSQPSSAWAFYGRGLARLREGDTAGGRTDLAMAMQIQPGIDQEFAKFGEVP
ncbi:MAG TPA: hypothetical protein DCL54_14090, partial [Alphaproteobacteria bacterium]|nr:hypothetical protein [Alphaproteobacteria bacterium]